MNTKKLQQFLKQTSREVVLRTEDKNLMREHLVSYMEFKPLRTSAETVSKPSLFSILGLFRAHHLTGAFMIAILVTTGTFGMSFAADDALPGDLLYPMKVKVNEGVKTVFILSDEARIVYERERAELRLHEASRLASEGRLDPKRQATVSKLFAEHTDSITQRVQNTERVDPVFAAEMSAELETALSTHEVVLARLMVESGEQVSEGARELIGQVRSATQEAGRMREVAEERLTALTEEDDIQIANVDDPGVGIASSNASPTQKQVTPLTPKTESANLRERATYRAEERAKKNLERVKELLPLFPEGSELVMQSRNQLISANMLVQLGDEALGTHDLTRAYGYYREAGASLQKVTQLLEVAHLFSVEILPDMGAIVSKNGEETASLNDQTLAIEEAHKRVEKMLREIRTLLLTQEGYDIETVSQANTRIKDATALLMRGEIAVILGDLTKAEALFLNADRIVTRAHEQLMIAGKQQNVRIVPVPEVPVKEESEDDANTLENPINIIHGVLNTSHEFTGTLPLSFVPCISVATGSVSASTTAKEITLSISTELTADTCGDVVDNTTTFTLTVEAPADATLVNVRINNKSYPFTLESPGELDMSSQ
jgi:hypothetical protein